MPRGLRLDAEGALHYITQSVLGGMGGRGFSKEGMEYQRFY